MRSPAGDEMKTITTGSHWGLYEVDVAGGRIRDVRPSPQDGNPTPMHRALPAIVDHPSRVRSLLSARAICGEAARRTARHAAASPSSASVGITRSTW